MAGMGRATAVETGDGPRAAPPSTAHLLRRIAPRLLAGAVVVYLFLAGCGLLLTRVLDGSGVARDDQRVSRWFLHQRTPDLNQATRFGSDLSNTQTAIVVTAVLVVLLRWWLGRWRESIVVVTCILGELWIFLAVTSTVHRARPTVPHLDPAPPTSSFPSGHVGAAVALYLGLAVLLWRVVARRGVRVAAVVVLACLPVAVAISRLYRGMHYLTDVLAGAIAGGLWMVIAVATLTAAIPGPAPRSRSSADAR